MANVTILEQLKKLDEQRAQLIDGAKAAAIKKAEDGITELKELGFNYSLVEDGAAPKRKGGAGQKRERDPNKPCGVCGFVTEPPHDGRAHKNKQETATPFTAAELKKYGYAKRQ